jgi:hypothetical protein
METTPIMSVDEMYNLAIEAYKHCKQKRDEYSIDEIQINTNAPCPEVCITGGCSLVRYPICGWSVEGVHSTLTRRKVRYIKKYSKQWIDDELQCM